MRGDVFGRMVKAIVNLDPQGARLIAQEAVESGVPPMEAIKAFSKGLEIVGELFERNEYFLADMIMAADAFKEAMDVLRPHIRGAGGGKGRIVIGTVKDDVHDLGKNVVATLLAAEGYEVYDLGVDVPAEKFLEKVKEVNADILGLSALLTTTMERIREVIGKLEEEGLRGKVKVIVGGRPVTPEFAEEVGADGYGRDAIAALKVVKELLEGGK
ncbi:MAG: cobalamin B12-binding domain-containing protein [Candidatus Freyarchaeota archaeon]|nr:corrinoid protein [Candidatus Freyrarchaeum guaymaensis]